MKTIVLLSAIVFSFPGFGQELKLVYKNGEEITVPMTDYRIMGKWIKSNAGASISYDDVSYLSTSDFDTYDKLVSKAGSRYEHLNIQFTGDENLYALKLKKLEEKRNAAHAARGAGGLMMLIGAFSGDEDVYRAGAATYAVGTVARDINTENTISAQNEAIVELQEQQKKQDPEAQELEEYEREYGRENVEGLIALVENDHERALALANVGELSENEDHHISAVWLKAIIYSDQGNEEALEKELKKLVDLDPELDSLDAAKKWMTLLMMDLEELRS